MLWYDRCFCGCRDGYQGASFLISRKTCTLSLPSPVIQYRRNKSGLEFPAKAGHQPTTKGAVTCGCKAGCARKVILLHWSPSCWRRRRSSSLKTKDEDEQILWCADNWPHMLPRASRRVRPACGLSLCACVCTCGVHLLLFCWLLMWFHMCTDLSLPKAQSWYQNGSTVGCESFIG